MRNKLTYFIVLLTVSAAISQTHKRNFKQREIGVLGGASYYLGDINPRAHFANSQIAGGLFFRYTTNYRYAFRFGFNYGTVTASDSKSSDPDQLLRNLNFRSRIYELNAIAEFNFVEYRIGHDKHYFTMFLFAGLAGYHFNPQGNLGGGWENLAGLRTEGQSKAYRLYQISIPFGVGFKYNLTENIGIGLEWGPRKTFTDYLDDVSGLYPDPKINPPAGSAGMTYAFRNKEAFDVVGTMRGNPRTKDWYFFYGLTLNFKLPNPNRPCHGVGMSN